MATSEQATPDRQAAAPRATPPPLPGREWRSQWIPPNKRHEGTAMAPGTAIYAVAQRRHNNELRAAGAAQVAHRRQAQGAGAYTGLLVRVTEHAGYRAGKRRTAGGGPADGQVLWRREPIPPIIGHSSCTDAQGPECRKDAELQGL